MSDPGRSLKIAQMLETDGPGGAEVVVFNMGHERRDRRHTVLPVGPSHRWLSKRFRESGFEPQPFSLRRTLDPRRARPGRPDASAGDRRRAQPRVYYGRLRDCGLQARGPSPRHHYAREPDDDPCAAQTGRTPVGLSEQPPDRGRVRSHERPARPREGKC